MKIRNLLAGCTFAVAAAFMATSANAVTVVTANCGDQFNVPSEGTLFTGNTPDPSGGGAGSCQVRFDAEQDPLLGDALGTIGPIVFGQYTGLTMSWVSVATNTVLGTINIAPSSVSLATTFASPDNLSQYFLISWTGSDVNAAGFDFEITITRVPEPGSLAILGLGLLGLGVARRRNAA